MLKLLKAVVACFIATSSFSQLNIDSIGYISLHTMHQQMLNDIWGYVDETGNEYALVGGTKGTSVVDISNPSNPVEIFYEPGMESIWRDLKTYGDYAYVTTEALNGLLIIDLSPLPAGPIVTTSYYTGSAGSEWQSAHNLYVDSSGYAYIFGANRGNGGVIILDVATDPLNPIEVGVFDDWYVHDGFVQNDTMYLGHITDGFFSVVDLQDRSNPILLGVHDTPSTFSHNVWSKGSQYAFTTDEVPGGFLGAYDISDPANIIELDRIQSSPGANVIPHNTHVYGNYLVTSYYSDGVTVHDVTHPYNMIEVGNYDTYPTQTTSYDGCWGAFPFFPSGLMVLSDRTEGMFVLDPTYVQAAYLEGIVTNSVTTNPIDLVDVQIVNHNQVDQSNNSGFYATGILNSGAYDVTYSKVGYFPQTISVNLTNGVITTQDVQLVPIPPYSLSVTVLESGTNNPVDGAQILLEADLISHSGVTNALGQETFTLYYQEEYGVNVGKWEYITYCDLVNIDNQTGALTIFISPGYYDDFTFDFGWSTSNSAQTGLWERGMPNGTDSQSQTSYDSDNDCNEYCYVTGNSDASTHPDHDDVDGGYTNLISPVMDLTGYADPYLNYERWFYCYHGVLPPGDSLEIFLSNGTVITRIDVQSLDTALQSQWIEKNIRVMDFLTPTSTMQVFFNISDADPDVNITEAGLDHFYVVEAEFVGQIDIKNPRYMMYPNPASEVVYVNGLDGDINYEIISIQGNHVQSGTLSPVKNEIQVSNLVIGVYFIRLGTQIQKIAISK